MQNSIKERRLEAKSKVLSLNPVSAKASMGQQVNRELHAPRTHSVVLLSTDHEMSGQFKIAS